MGQPTKLIELLNKAHANLTIRNLGGKYNHVIVECHDFTLGDFLLRYFSECCKESGYSGYYLTPYEERESKARHYIVFYS